MHVVTPKIEIDPAKRAARTDTTQESGQTPDKEVKLGYSVAYGSGCTERDPTGVFSPSNFRLTARNKLGFFKSTVWPDTCCSEHMIQSATDKTDLIELVTNMRLLWDQRDKHYHNRDLKRKLWE
jgi:hypothetical protein